MVDNSVISKLLNSSNTDDNMLGLEFQYDAFKHGYTNWYKREKYNKEFRKRIFRIGPDRNNFIINNNFVYDCMLNGINIREWFQKRLEEDFKT